ncbi:MAG: hypothetical protein ACRDGB_12535 [Candidatus Limnocylindria bacterium]
MDDNIGVRQLRQQFHANLARVARGQRLILLRRGRREGLLRAALPEDDGRPTPVSEFRRTIPATIRRAHRRPQILTLYGEPLAVLERYQPDRSRS